MPRITRDQRGCTCRFPVGFEAEGESPACCAHCASPPCEYLALWKCDIHYLSPVLSFGGESGVVNLISFPKVMPMAIDCHFEGNCTWTSYAQKLVAVPGVPSGTLAGGALIPTPGPGAEAYCEPSNWREVAGQIAIPPTRQSGTSYIYDRVIFGCSGQAGTGTGNSLRCGWTDAFGMSLSAFIAYLAALIANNYVALRMEITSPTTATLVATSLDCSAASPSIPSYTVNYACANFNCNAAENEFIIDAYPHQQFPLFPARVCVVKGFNNYRTPCVNAAAACLCCDNGAETLILSGNPACTLTRNAELPASVADPNGDCGYFWGECLYNCAVGTGTGTGIDYQFSLGILIYCDAGDIIVKIYCIDDSGTGTGGPVYTLVDTVTATRTECCPFFQFTFTFTIPDDSYCTCIATVPVCNCDIPQALFTTLAAGSCAGLNGTVIPITYTGTAGGVSTWAGDFTPSWGTCNYPLTFFFATQETISCKYIMWIEDSTGTVIWGTNDFANGVGLTCPFVSANDVGVNNTVPLCLVSIVPPLCGGSMTATVTP